ncbi:MAG: DNA helicase, partial [Nostoc sp.]
AIVFKPDKGTTYIILWVDNLDDAYNWAQRRVSKINPESGALQIIDIEEASAIEAEISSRKVPEIPGRFDNISDKYLLRLGVPNELLGAIRAVVTDEDIDQLVSKLPEEAADSVLMLGAGYSIEEILAAQDKN